MQLSQFHYLPLTPGFFSILVGMFSAAVDLVWCWARCATPI